MTTDNFHASVQYGDFKGTAQHGMLDGKEITCDE